MAETRTVTAEGLDWRGEREKEIAAQIIGARLVDFEHDGQTLWLTFDNGVLLFIGDSDRNLVGTDPKDAPYDRAPAPLASYPSHSSGVL